MKKKGNSLKIFEVETANIWKKSGVVKRREVLILFNRRLAFLQHERLVHLLVTLFFGGASLFLGWAVLNGDRVYLPIILLIILVVTIFYVFHYYFLENICQKWQGLSIEMEKELLIGKK